MDQIPIMNPILITAGLQSGTRSPEEVQTIFGINVHNWPDLFQVRKDGKVWKLPEHENVFRQYAMQQQQNRNALGLS